MRLDKVLNMQRGVSPKNLPETGPATDPHADLSAWAYGDPPWQAWQTGPSRDG